MPYTGHSSAFKLADLPTVGYRKALKLLLRWVPGNSLRIFIMRRLGYEIGEQVYIGEDLIVSEILEYRAPKVKIGDRVAIAQRVTLITSSDANWSHLTDLIAPIQGEIRIEDDAWIGAGAIILPNITVGSMSIVAAGAVVTRDVSPHTVVAGVPAQFLKKVEHP